MPENFAITEVGFTIKNPDLQIKSSNSELLEKLFGETPSALAILPMLGLTVQAGGEEAAERLLAMAAEGATEIATTSEEPRQQYNIVPLVKESQRTTKPTAKSRTPDYIDGQEVRAFLRLMSFETLKRVYRECDEAVSDDIRTIIADILLMERPSA